MTVSGSGRTREKDTRAPARGPFCVLGSSLAGEEGVLLQGGVLPFGGPPFRMHAGSPADICGKTRGFPSLSAPPYGRASARSLHPYTLSGKFGAPRQRSLCTHMPVLTDSPYPFFTYAAGVPVPLSFLVLTPEAAGRSIEQDSLVEYLSLTSFWVLYERVLRGVGEFEGARGSFLAQGKVPLAPSKRSSRHPQTFVVPSLS